MLRFDKVLGDAWRIIWKHKVLWLFGILASCGSQSSQNINTNYSFPSGEGSFNGSVPPELERFLNQFQRYFQNGNEKMVWMVAGLILLLLLLSLLFFLIGIYGRVGLIQGTVLSEQNAPALLFSDVHQKIKPYYWRAVLLNLVISVIILITTLVVLFLVIFGGIITLGIGLVCLIPLLCLLTPLFILVGLVVEQANIALVLEDLSLGDAFQRGWQIFRINLGSMIVMALILIVGGAIIGIIISLPFIFALMPLLIAIMTSTPVDSSAFTLGSVSLICAVIYLPVLIVLNGILRGYIGCAWTLTFRELTQLAETEMEVIS